MSSRKDENKGPTTREEWKQEHERLQALYDKGDKNTHPDVVEFARRQYLSFPPSDDDKPAASKSSASSSK